MSSSIPSQLDLTVPPRTEPAQNKAAEDILVNNRHGALLSPCSVHSCRMYLNRTSVLLKGIHTMTNNPSSNETQKPASPAPTPQQQTQGDPKQNTDKQGGQQQK